ncbi:MAG: hypothetical protein ABFS09_00200 [Thermodesulfobacteriota bacterium]
MKAKTIIFTLSALLTTSTSVFGKAEYVKQYQCPIEGCSITCITKSEGTLQIKEAKRLTMYIYPSGTTVYEAKISFGEKKTIVTGESGVCKIDHK